MTDAKERIGQSIGDYRLQRLLGQGRFGTAYLAEHLYEHTPAAVKVLHMPLTGPNDFDVFLKEARTVRLLHPHIVSLFDFDLGRDGLPYLTMTYADGGSLRDRYPQGSKLPLQTIDTYVQQVASALQYAHDCHVTHHDIKPENILMSTDGTVRLSDFCIAKVSGQASQYTQPKVIGTPAYTAPEQDQGQPCPASDQYALAIVVYEWLTGQCPFQGEPFAIAAQHQTDTPPSLSSISPEVPFQVEEVIFQALAKAPKDRYPTITYFAEALHAALQEDDEPTQIVPKLDISQADTAPILLSDVPVPQITPSETENDEPTPTVPELDISQADTAPVPLSDIPSPQMMPPETTAGTSLSPQLVLASPPDAQTSDVDELHNAPTWEWASISIQDEATPAFPTAIAPTAAATEEKLQPQAIRQEAEIPASLPGTEPSQSSSAIAKVRLKKMTQHQPAASHTPKATSPSPRPQVLSTGIRLLGSIAAVVIMGASFAKTLTPQQLTARQTLRAAWQYLRPHVLSASRKLANSIVAVVIMGTSFVKKMTSQQLTVRQTLRVVWQHLRPYVLSISRKLASSIVAVVILGASFVKKMMPQQLVALQRLGAPLQRSRPLPAWVRPISSFLIVVVIGGGFAVLSHSFSAQPPSPTHKSGATAISQVSSQYHLSTPAPQHPTPVPTPAPTPIPPPPVIAAAIPAGNLLYSTPAPFAACDKLGGHWTDTSGVRVTCNADGSEMVNTSGNLAVANLDQLGGNQSSWPCQNCIVQVQATINSNSQGGFGIDFQSDGNDNAQGYFAYVLNPPNGWAFNYYNTPGNLTSTLIASQLLSSVPNKLTIDIRVEGTFYAFYVNGVDTTGRAVTGSQYSNKIVGLAVDANADITFSNLAIYALP